MTLSKKEQNVLNVLDKPWRLKLGSRALDIAVGLSIYTGILLVIFRPPEISVVEEISAVTYFITQSIILSIYEDFFLTFHGIIEKLRKNKSLDIQDLHQGVDMTLSRKEQFELKIAEGLKKYSFFIYLVFIAAIFIGILEVIFKITVVRYSVGLLIVSGSTIVLAFLAHLLTLYRIIEKLRRDSTKPPE